MTAMKPLVVRLSEDDHAALRAVAAQRGVSMGEAVRVAVRGWMFPSEAISPPSDKTAGHSVDTA